MWLYSDKDDNMTDRVIAFLRNGKVSLLWPSEPYPIEEVAKKDVPVGTPYIIMDASDIPTDPAFRDAWVLDLSQPDGYGMGYSDVINKMVVEKYGTSPQSPPIDEKDRPWPKV